MQWFQRHPTSTERRGLVVNAEARRSGGPRFETRRRRFLSFFGINSNIFGRYHHIELAQREASAVKGNDPNRRREE